MGMGLAQLKRLIRRASPSQRKRLYEWLGELTRGQDVSGPPAAPIVRSEKTAESAGGGRTYRQQGVRCGKKGCKCAGGKLHGPYWYAYWMEDGETKSQYVGKEFRRTE